MWLAGVLLLSISQPVTFNRDVAPVLHGHCAPCHRPGGSGPFHLLTYQDARRRARQIVEVTASRFMPPWQPSPDSGEFVGQRRLSPAQIDTLRRWVEQGAAEGDPPAPAPPSFPEGWELGRPDLVVTLEQAYELPAEGRDVFRNFVIPLPVNQRRYVRALELRPGNPRVVHHAVMQLARRGACDPLDARDPEPGFPGMEMGESDTPSGQILSWTPGKRAQPAPEGLAWPLEPDSDLILQMHMLPSGKPEPIRPSVGFYFADEPPEREAVVYVLRDNRIDIPAGESHYWIEDAATLPVDVRVLSLYPHAHYLGKEIHVWADLPSGQRRPLLRIDDWDFDWQDQYFYRDPPRLPAGSRVVMRYRYDNSADNPRNPHHPPRRVRHGPGSGDEMGNLALQLLPVEPDQLARLREAQLEDVVADPGDPRAWVAHLHLGRLAQERDRPGRAREHYLQARRQRPGDYQPHYFLGELAQREGWLVQAEEHYRAALERDPGRAEVFNNLGALLGAQGRFEEAAEAFRSAVRLAPRDAALRLNLGHALGSEFEEAAGQYRAALALRPDWPEAHNALGIALARLGRLEEAVRHFEEALRLRPDYAEARQNLRALQP